jgi:hypothetical protein
MTEQAPIIDPDGAGSSFRHALDLRVSHAVFRRGDVIVWITWLRTTREPCIVLTPRDRVISHGRVVPCIVPLNRAWAWAEETGDPEDFMPSVGIFLANLGFNPLNKRNVIKLLSIIRDHLGDLLSCPPMPESPDRRHVADMTIINKTTGTTIEREVQDDE